MSAIRGRCAYGQIREQKEDMRSPKTNSTVGESQNGLPETRDLVQASMLEMRKRKTVRIKSLSGFRSSPSSFSAPTPECADALSLAWTTL